MPLSVTLVLVKGPIVLEKVHLKLKPTFRDIELLKGMWGITQIQGNLELVERPMSTSTLHPKC